MNFSTEPPLGNVSKLTHSMPCAAPPPPGPLQFRSDPEELKQCLKRAVAMEDATTNTNVLLQVRTRTTPIRVCVTA